MRAAIRDASWSIGASTHGKRLVFHVVRGEIDNEEGACGGHVIALEGFAPKHDVTVDAATVRPELRCRRPGCKARWPAWIEPEDAAQATAKGSSDAS